MTICEAVKKAMDANAYEFTITSKFDKVSYFHGAWYVNGAETESIPFRFLERENWILIIHRRQ